MPGTRILQIIREYKITTWHEGSGKGEPSKPGGQCDCLCSDCSVHYDK